MQDFLNYIEEGRGGVSPHYIREQFASLRRFRPLLTPYALFGLCVLAVLAVRPPESGAPPEQPAPSVFDPKVYVHVSSKAVGTVGAEERELGARLVAAVAERNYECLAAIHLGVPRRVMAVGDTVLVNPRIAWQGKTLSQAHETSAFFPERAPVRVTRFVPVRVAYQGLEGGAEEALFEGTSAHCVLNLLNQFEGRGIYSS